MSKVLVIPDVHQHTETLDLIKGDFDQCVVVGDYVDDWKSDEWWFYKYNNPLAILDRVKSLKDQYKEKIHFLLGNHDLGYFATRRLNPTLEFLAKMISGHQHMYHYLISEKFDEIADVFEIACRIDDVVYSHAGFSKTWVEFLRKSIGSDEEDVVKAINDVLKNSCTEEGAATLHYLLDHLSSSPCGDDELEGPLWIRPDALQRDMYFDKQVVGHTELKFPQFTYKEPKRGKKLTKFIYVVDTADHGTYSVVDNGVVV